MANSAVFSKLMNEHGNSETEESERAERADKSEKLDEGVKEQSKPQALMQQEERATGAVTWSVYSQYLRHAGSLSWGPTILILLILTQGSQGKLETLLYNAIPIVEYPL